MAVVTADRDRVTAILTLADEARARGTWADVDWDPEWAYRRLLEALNTIDRVRNTVSSLPIEYQAWFQQALNGGNE